MNVIMIADVFIVGMFLFYISPVILGDSPIPVTLSNGGGVHTALLVGELEVILHGNNRKVSTAGHSELNNGVGTALAGTRGTLSSKSLLGLALEILDPGLGTVGIVRAGINYAV